jgi:diacylglycerol kinase family enzyme
VTDRGPLGIIVNPRAGNGRALELLPRVVDGLGVDAAVRHVHVTAAPREATAIARRFVADGFGLVVAVGGDGTVNEVANGLVDPRGGTKTRLGIVPAGRGADLVRGLGWRREPAAALARIRRGAARTIDLGRATFGDGASRVFVNVAGVGLDAAASALAARSRLPGGIAPYLSSAAGALLRHGSYPMTVDVDGARVAGPMRAVIVANGGFFGGGLRIVPGAALDDGWLDAALVGDVSWIDLVRNARRVYRGTHVEHPKLTLLPGRAVRGRVPTAPSVVFTRSRCVRARSGPPRPSR